MTYKDTINWMFNKLPMYQKQGQTAYKKDLSNILLLSKHLNNPQQDFKSIHVAGTNGKGSTSHMLASILQEAGYKVGLYTSPHLKDFRERIKVNGISIEEQYVVAFIKKNKDFFENNKLSFFEMTVGLAFDYFSKSEIDIAIVEVGLGGRLDATNIITPEVSVITNIGLDHTQFLGDNINDIAKEKAGIIKQNIPVVISETNPITKDVFIKVASKNQSSIIFADQEAKIDLQTDLLGIYQNKNKQAAYYAIQALRSFVVPEFAIAMGLRNVVNNTGLLGRWQIISEKPKVICDTAHNAEGLSITMTQLTTEKFNSLHIVFGVVNDKDIDSISGLLPKEANYYFCQPNINRAMPSDKLYRTMKQLGFQGTKYASVKSALSAAKKTAKCDDIIYIGGSTFVVAEVI